MLSLLFWFAVVVRYNVYTYEGSDLPAVVASGRLKNNIVRDNTIIGGGKETIKLKAADGLQIIDNTFINPAKTRFQDSFGTVISGNTGLDGIRVRVTYGSCFDASSDAAYTPVC